jgi:hypothetical protein
MWIDNWAEQVYEYHLKIWIMEADGGLFVWGSFKDPVGPWQCRPITQFYRTIKKGT